MIGTRTLYRIRKAAEALAAEPGGQEDKQPTLTEQLETLAAQGAAPYQEIVRAGRAFWSGTTAAVAAVVAAPSTAHMFSIYNTEDDGGRSLVIDWVAALNVVSTAVASQAQMILNVGQVREAAPTNSAMTIKNMAGSGRVDSVARTLLTGTALPATTGIAANWFPWGQNGVKPGAAATPGYGMWAPVQGSCIVRPGRYFAMHVLANVVGETFVVFVGWHEKQLTLA